MIKNFHDNNLQGKTFLTAIFACVRAILFPGTQVVASSSTKKQAMLIYNKIEGLRQQSSNLDNEIESMSKASDMPIIRFKNGSTIVITASNENARGHRSNVLILDERERMNEPIIDTVLKKFNANPRQPKFYNKPEYRDYPREPNKTISLSSAGMKLRPLYRVFLDHLQGAVRGRRMFGCGLPYQISIKNGLLLKEDIEKDMEKSDFNQIHFSMEMEALFYGSSTAGFFSVDSFSKSQVEKFPLYPKWAYDLIDDKNFKYPEKETGELRTLSVDVALSNKENADNTILTVSRLIPNGNRYIRKPSFMLSLHGSHTEDLVLTIKRTFYDLDCDYALIDYRGLGIPIYDLCMEMTDDKERHTVYPAWVSFNNDTHAERCKEQSALPIVYTMVATDSMNTSMAYRFQDDLNRKYVRLPINLYDGREALSELNGYSRLSPETQAMFEVQYEQFDSLIMESVNMGYTINKSGTITFVKQGDKKDRYSSVTYANFLADLLEKDLSDTQSGDWEDYMVW